MTTHVMIDLETLSSKSNAYIISIGAVRFDPLDPTGELDCFHVGVAPQPGNHLFHIDPITVAWWFKAEQDAGRAAWSTLEKVDLATALEGFRIWFGDDKTTPVWGNGATFDNVILRNAFDAMYLECPWSYRADRCYRTLKALAPNVEADKTEGVQHDALADAVHQARHLRKIMLATNEWRQP